MKGWQRSARLAQLAGWAIALLWMANRGQALSQPAPQCTVQQPWLPPAAVAGEPPLADSPTPPKTPVPPSPPFTAPLPTPLAPEETNPLPGMPFPGAEPRDPQVPIVRLRVRVPARVQPDKDIEYRLTIENISGADAHHVVVRDRLPAGTRFVRAEPKPSSEKPAKGGVTDLLWDFGTLKAGQQKGIVLFINPAGTDEVQNSAYVQFEHGQTVKTRIAKPGVRVRATAPAQALLHDPIIFRLDVTNTGPATAKDVVLTDELPDGLQFIDGKPSPKPEKPLTWKLGDLPPGQSRHLEYQVISKQTGTFHNKAEVKAAGGVHQKARASLTVGEAKLSLLKTGPQRRLVNRPTPYQITVSNPGTVPATGVQVSDELPSGIEFLGASDGGRVANGQVHWSLGTLPPGAARVLQVVIRAPRPGRFGNMAQAKAEHNLSAKVLAETHFESASGATVEIDKSADPLEVGQKATYTIRLINPAKTAFLRPSLVITVPGEMTVLGQRGPTTAQRDGPIIHFDPLPALDAGREVIYTVEVEAKKAGEARLRVELTDGRAELGAPRIWEEKTTIRGAARLVPRPGPAALQVSRTR
jgi:uncharacterized repeat protein (TIGR01451 family)